MEKDANQELVAHAAKPTGGVISLLTREEGALVDAFDHAGYTALHVAAAAADADAISALCAAGARFDVQAANDSDESDKGGEDDCILSRFKTVVIYDII